jgi:hypothetical protein
MNKSIMSLAFAVCFVLMAATVVHARGFGGCSGAGSRGGYSGGGYHGSSYHGGSSGQSYHGAEGGTAYRGPEGGTAYHGAEGGTAYHGAEGGTAYRGAEGGTAYHSPDSGTVYRGPGGTTAYSNAHATLPTDAGYGARTAGTGAGAYAGYHQTEPANSNVYAARGAAVRTNYAGGYGMYGQGWYGSHPSAWAVGGWTGGQAWSGATWPAVGATFGYGGSVQPNYYDYGNSVTYQGNQVYYGDQPVASADQYYQQASTLATSDVPADPNSGDWMPLGVFALVQKDQSDPHFIMQLAVNKAGAVRGNYTDLMSGTNTVVQGAVDKKSQRVAWTVGDNKRTVGETGLYNLTKEESPALIHLGKDKTQQWTLVRLKPPQQGDKSP